jgi:hypothetical protein
MMGMRKKLIWVVVIFLSGIVILPTGLFFSQSFFTLNYQINSNALILEAWISPFEAEQAIPLIKSDSVKSVIVVGKAYPDNRDSILSQLQAHFNNPKSNEENGKDGIWLLTNSSLAFNLNEIPKGKVPYDSLIICIKAKGSEVAGFFAHFNLVINGMCCGNSFSCAHDSTYYYFLLNPAEGLQSVIVHFDNDLVHHGQDRNLKVISISVGDTEIKANDHNTFYTRNEGKYSNGFDSQAAEMKNYLLQLGVPSQKVSDMSFEPVMQNQTLAAAHAFISSPFSSSISSVNIVSSGLHSRRTWLTYKRVLGKETLVGVVNFEQSDFRKGTREENISHFLQLMDEASSYLFNWIFLTFGGT